MVIKILIFCDTRFCVFLCGPCVCVCVCVCVHVINSCSRVYDSTHNELEVFEKRMKINL